MVCSQWRSGSFCFYKVPGMFSPLQTHHIHPGSPHPERLRFRLRTGLCCRRASTSQLRWGRGTESSLPPVLRRLCSLQSCGCWPMWCCWMFAWLWDLCWPVLTVCEPFVSLWWRSQTDTKHSTAYFCVVDVSFCLRFVTNSCGEAMWHKLSLNGQVSTPRSYLKLFFKSEKAEPPVDHSLPNRKKTSFMGWYGNIRELGGTKSVGVSSRSPRPHPAFLASPPGPRPRRRRGPRRCRAGAVRPPLVCPRGTAYRARS